MAIGCALAAGNGAPAASLVTTIVTDPLTGVAIDGYDPVSYFTGSDPQPGKPDFEYDWGGVPWYFESAANRDVFAHNPTVYAPQYGGHCLMSLSRGFLSDGKPRLYAIEAMKLYFFYSTANRDAFLLSKSAALAQAGKNWPELAKQLSGPESETSPAAPLTEGTSSASSELASSAEAPADPLSAAPAAAPVAPPSAGGNVTSSDSSEMPHG